MSIDKPFIAGRDGSVGTATRYELDDPGTHTSSYTMGTGSLSRG